MKRLTTLFAAFALAALSVQAAYFDLAKAPYNLTQSDYAVRVSDKYATGKDTIALPDAWRAFKGREWQLTYAQFRTLYYFSAVFTDAGWHGEKPTNAAKGFLNEFNFVDVPEGRFQSTVSLTIPRGGFAGKGTFGYYPDSYQWTTEFTMDDAGWIDTDRLWHERVLFSTPQWNDETFYSYNESYHVYNIHLSGPDKNDGRTRIGIAFGRSGEASDWDRIKSDEWDYGIMARQGVPMVGGTCSVFGNRIAGFAGIGCALASMRIAVISGDRNGSLMLLADGYGAPGGGNLDVGLAKAEDANPQGGGAYGSQIVGRFSGQFHVTIANVRFSCDTRLNDALFVVDPIIHTNPEWGTQGSYLRATGQGFHYNTLVHNLATGKRIGNTADYHSWSFEWFADGNTFASNGPGDWTWKPAGSVALASLARDPMTGAAIGSWNYAAGTPARVDNVGTVTPPTYCTSYTYTVTSKCADGSWKTRTAVGKPSGCTGGAPTDSLTRDCVVGPCVWTYAWPSTWGPCVNGSQSQTQAATSTGDCTGQPAKPQTRSQACGTTPPSGTLPPRSSWKAVGYPNPTSWPQENAIDSDPNSVWMSGRAQTVGTYLQVDFGVVVPFTSVTFTYGKSLYDYPGQYKVQTTTDGTTWQDITGTLTGKYAQPVRATGTFRGKSVRLYVVKPNGKMWLTIGDVQVQ